MKVNESQPYIIGFLFYKFLSEKMQKEILEASKGKVEYKNLNNDQIIYEKTKKAMIDRLGYFIEYKETFHSVLEDCQFNPENLIERLQIAFKNIEDSTLGQESSKEFNGLFSDIVLDAKVLGQNSIERSENLLSIMKELNIPELNINNMDNDVLGDTYEFLIGKFAAESGEKAGEFYTPKFVSNLLMKLVTNNVKEATYVYDPTCGSGSLLVKARNYLEKYGKLLGQEKSTSTYNMARMNLFLHGVKYKDFQIENGNTLTDNKFKDLAEKIDLVVANPPFSVD